MVDLAVYEGEAPVTLSALAGMQGVSEAYLEQLLRALRRAGIVETVRGAAGGYRLRPGTQAVLPSRRTSSKQSANTSSRCAAITSPMPQSVTSPVMPVQ